MDGDRQPNLSPEKMNHKGVELFEETYGDKTQEVRSLLSGLHPDFGMHIYPSLCAGALLIQGGKTTSV